MHGEAMPLDAVDDSLEGAPNGRLAVELGGRFEELMIFLVGRAELGFGAVVLEIRRAAPHLPIYEKERLLVFRADGHDGRTGLLRHFLEKLPPRGPEHGEVKRVVDVSRAVNVLLELRG